MLKQTHYAVRCGACHGTGFDRAGYSCEQCDSAGRILIKNPSKFSNTDLWIVFGCVMAAAVCIWLLIVGFTGWQ